MFTRSTLPTLAAIASLACGASAGAEAFDPSAVLPGRPVRQNHSLSSSYALRGDSWSLRSLGRDTILPGLPYANSLRSEFGAPWLGNSALGASRAGSRLNFHRAPDDVRAGDSSASITLGRLNLNESRSPIAALGGMSQADLDRELAQLRESVNRVRLVPQVSLGMHVKF
jgi:hypothetical protein